MATSPAHMRPPQQREKEERDFIECSGYSSEKVGINYTYCVRDFLGVVSL